MINKIDVKILKGLIILIMWLISNINNRVKVLISLRVGYTNHVHTPLNIFTRSSNTHERNNEASKVVDKGLKASIKSAK